MSSLSDYSETAWLNHLLRNTAYSSVATVYAALYTSTPSDSGGGTEVTAGGYTRQAVTFGAASGRGITNSAPVSWTASGGNYGTVVAVGIFDASSGGNLLAWDGVANKDVNDGETYTIATGDFDISVGSGGLTTWAVDGMLDRMFRNQAFASPATVYGALFTADPSDAGGGTEVTAGGYTRQSMAFDAPSGGACDNSAQTDFTASGGNFGTVTAAGIFDASSAGNLMWYDTAFDEGDATINDGDTFRIIAGGMTWTIT